MALNIPAEWETHKSTWLAWPYDTVSFGSLNEARDKFNPDRLPRVKVLFNKIIEELQSGERVELLVRPEQHSDILQNVGMLKNVRMHEVDYADVWTRDYMPSFVMEGITPQPPHKHSSGTEVFSMEKSGGKMQAVKWNYDAYGNKFPQLKKDDDVWNMVNSNLKINTIKPGRVLEGGAIEVNGQGTLLTTEQSLFARNPDLNKEGMEKLFAEYLGISKVIWLKEGIVNDHTDGHIDDVARFVAPNKIVCAFESNPSDPNFAILQDSYKTLKSDFEVVKLPMPHMTYHNGEKAPASYANFYIANGVVLIPSFNDPNDSKAFDIIKSQFPDRRAVAINCSDLIYGGGAIHCATREVPMV